MLLGCVWMAAGSVVYAATPAAAVRNGYDYYQAGDLHAARTGPTEPALMLKGGGAWNNQAFAWLLAKGGHGHFVVLRASYGDEIQNALYNEIGGVASVQTLVFHSRAAASDPAVLDIIRRADGIFISGGDQANYVRFWRGTPLNRLLDEHVAHGKPIGGTSAGLAILGGYGYGALDGGSIVSADALADPLGAPVSLVGDFLHMPYLRHVITDSHFTVRDRLGRLLAFVARLRHEGDAGVVGLGVDEGTALCVDGAGVGRVFTMNNGFAWLLQPAAPVPRIIAGKPLDDHGVRVIGIGTQSRINMRDLSVQQPVFAAVADVREGRLILRGRVAPLLVIHAGAGVQSAGMTAQDEADARAALTSALRSGYAQLSAGKPAREAVTAAISTLEDSPLFNAGKGAVFTHDGKHELDASIMDGATLVAGAVAGVQRIRNPILLARAVMEHSPDVLLVGDGAEQFATTQGFSLVDPAYFRTDRRWNEWQQARTLDVSGDQAETRPAAASHVDTVGAVARDTQGRLAAGTSTGGMSDNQSGRVGAAPMIGAGTYADVACAVSGTGWGGFAVRVGAARAICLRMTLMGESARDAGRAVLNQEIPQLGGEGGAIILGADGSMAMPFNTQGMYRGWIGADGVPHVAIHGADPLTLPMPQR